MLFLLFYLTIPVFLRFRFSLFSHVYWVGFSQDLFLTLGICLLIPISPFLTAGLGLFFHLYLLLDAWLMHHMHLRMKLCYLRHIRDLTSLYSSARKMGLFPFLAISTCLISVHILFLSQFSLNFPLWYIPFFLGSGIIAFIGTSQLGTQAYAVNNPLFQEMLNLQKHIKGKKSDTSPIPNSFHFSGPKLLNLENMKEPPHIIFLFLESFGQKATGTKSTPHYEKLKQEGFFFSRFYSNGTLTYRALLSALFGIPPGSSAEGLKPYVKVPFFGLPEILKRAGYQTSFQQSGSLCFDRQKDFLKPHFDELYDHHNISTSPCFGWGIDDEHLMHYSINWLENQKKPTFLTLFTISNHHPWLLPKHYNAPSFGFPPNHPQERFLQTIHYTDSCLGLFVDLLKEKQLSKKTILFILGDHGQPMGEHQDNFCNSRFLFEENVHIPLLILADGNITQPKEIDTLSSQVDLMPTIIDLLNLKLDLPHVGDSLLRENQDRTIFLQNPYSEGFMAARTGPWKWISGELYHLIQDPQEIHNIAALHPEIEEYLHQQSEQFFASIDAYYSQLSLKTTPLLDNVELDFSESLIFDQELINTAHEAIREIRLENCLLLTDYGITSLFQKCPYLERVYLKGITDLTDDLFEKGVPKNLQKLDLSSAHQISDTGLLLLLHACPNLSDLALNGRNLTSQGLKRIGPRLSHFKLFEGPNITEEAFLHFFQNSNHLRRLVLKDCPHLSDKVLSALQHHPLEQLWIHGESLITKEGAVCLKTPPLRSLVIESIALIKETGTKKKFFSKAIEHMSF